MCASGVEQDYARMRVCAVEVSRGSCCCCRGCNLSVVRLASSDESRESLLFSRVRVEGYSSVCGSRVLLRRLERDVRPTSPGTRVVGAATRGVNSVQ